MRQELTPEQQETLRENTNVLRCTTKQITFTEEFKTNAMAKYAQGFSSGRIFRESGLDTGLIGKKTPKWCIQGWKKQLRMKGNFADRRGRSGKGGRKSKERIPTDEKEKMKYLEMKVAYLEKENAFLAKLRKQRLNYDPPKSSESSDR